MYAAELAADFPRIDVDPNVLFVDAGDGIFTSAGTAAGIDLCLHLVRIDHGAEVANALARRMVVPPQRDGGQAQFVDAPLPAAPQDDPIGRTLDWAIAHLDEAITVEEMARQAYISPRSFARRFRASTGTTPMQWLARQRVLHAQRLLESTDLPVEVVAQRCGFGTATGLRTHFRRLAGTSPVAYRRTFRLVEVEPPSGAAISGARAGRRFAALRSADGPSGSSRRPRPWLPAAPSRPVRPAAPRSPPDAVGHHRPARPGGLTCPRATRSTRWRPGCGRCWRGSDLVRFEAPRLRRRGATGPRHPHRGGRGPGEAPARPLRRRRCRCAPTCGCPARGTSTGVGERWQRPRHQLRVLVEAANGWQAVCFNAPEVEVYRRSREPSSSVAPPDPAGGTGATGATGAVPAALARLGPDLCEPDADLDAVLARLARLVAHDGTVEVGDALLNQTVAAGVGNVYKSEACFACRLDPFTPLADVADDDRRALYATAHRMLRANLGAGPRRTHASGLAVYGKPGRPCPRCGTPIRVRRQGPHARATYWCPSCQSRPA